MFCLKITLIINRKVCGYRYTIYRDSSCMNKYGVYDLPESLHHDFERAIEGIGCEVSYTAYSLDGCLKGGYIQFEDEEGVFGVEDKQTISGIVRYLENLVTSYISLQNDFDSYVTSFLSALRESGLSGTESWKESVAINKDKKAISIYLLGGIDAWYCSMDMECGIVSKVDTLKDTVSEMIDSVVFRYCKDKRVKIFWSEATGARVYFRFYVDREKCLV